MHRLATLGGLLALTVGTADAGVLDAGLEQALEEAPADETLSVLVYLQDRVLAPVITQEMDARRATLRLRHKTVVNALRDKAQATQAPLLEHLDALQAQGQVQGFRAFWVSNIVAVDALPDAVEQIAARPDVEIVFPNYEITLVEPVAGGDEPQAPPVGGVEPGVAAVRAPEVWALGITGEGTLVATLDTGVDGNHPALASRWRGLDPAYAGNPEWAWFDPVTNTTFPQAFGSHGTHTMGTVCGGAPGDQVGVAPGAQWMHAAVIDRVSISQTVVDAIASFQWMVDPDGDPETNFDVPDACSNSWGLADFHGYPDCDETFWEFLDNAEAAGIVISFAAGNEGFSGLRRPADRATDDYRTFAVAAVDGNNPSFPIAGFSSRGPTFCTPGGEAATKPDIAAPGVSVRSCEPGGGYYFSDGTSMAAPHINGVVALIREANPNLSVEEVKQIIFDTAQDLGVPGEDNDYGWGIADAYEAVQEALAQATLVFSFPDGLPDLVDPDGGTTVTLVVAGQQASPDPDSGLLHYSTGGPYDSVAMIEVAPGEYQATFPALPCGSDVSYYFSVDTEEGETVFNPFAAPDESYAAQAYAGPTFAFQDDFETDQLWVVHNSINLTDGPWERGTPDGAGDQGDPPQDADGSGQCYVTGLAEGEDVDDGVSALISPLLDATDPTATIGYWRWYSNTTGGSPENDVFEIDATDGGGTWVNLETIGPSGPGVDGGWVRSEFLIADVEGLENTDTLRIRFTASDAGFPSTIEAAVDGVEIITLVCDEPCADLDGDGVVGTSDFLALLAAWGPNPGHPADLDGDGQVGVEDFLELLSLWGPCP